MPTAAIMFQGTGSDTGKSLITAGLCRALLKRGIRVAPFKPQNMSNNAAVTADGGEIGRAQALQARAAKITPSIHMNPVLLKPQAAMGAQVIVHGQHRHTVTARDYYGLKSTLLPCVKDSFHHLCKGADMILVEGAGSPAEVNLRAGDIANMGFAQALNVPVVLIGDIDRGGVIASIIGTWDLLQPQERALLKGYIINKFRGEPALFNDALTLIGERTRLLSLGIVPYFDKAHLLPAEDSMALSTPHTEQAGDGVIHIAVPRMPSISNFDDLDPLRVEEDVNMFFVREGEVLPVHTDVVVLPGSKSTIDDYRYLCTQGWDVDILAHHRRGGMVVGVCGGYQMLGMAIHDPDAIEGPIRHTRALGLLEVETTLAGDKTLSLSTVYDGDTSVQGYEIHMGRTTGKDTQTPWLRKADGTGEGAVRTDGRVMGCYLHGLFNNDGFRANFLRALRASKNVSTEPNIAVVPWETRIEHTLDALAEHLEEALDVDALIAIASAKTPPVKSRTP